MLRLAFVLCFALLAPVAHAATFLTAPADYDFGNIAVGQVHQETLVFDTSHWNFVKFDDTAFVPGAIGTREYSTGDLLALFDGPNDAFELTVTGCGVYSGPNTVCIDAKVTSSFDTFSDTGMLWRNTFNIFHVFPDGSEDYFYGNDRDYGSVLRYTPVPVPLPPTLPFLMGGLIALFGFGRVRRPN